MDTIGVDQPFQGVGRVRPPIGLGQVCSDGFADNAYWWMVNGNGGNLAVFFEAVITSSSFTESVVWIVSYVPPDRKRRRS